ncbi:MAG TPA: aldehyde dehydrogenase family protein [Polyangiaceae bacterium]|nr:aldehyde dehydrogenase family protein [Polyangiaceae bacterium]
MAKSSLEEAALADAAALFSSQSIGELGGPDPVAALYAGRRAGYSLFSLQLSDAGCEGLRPYLFGRPLPSAPGDPPARCLNLIDGRWERPDELVPMKALWDRRVTLFELARSREAECIRAVERAHAFWRSMDWASEGMAYRKHVIKNFARLLHYFYEDCLHELRQQVPKTRIEADKDFWEAKRAADHLEGSVEKAMQGEIVPTMQPAQAYWKNAYVAAGVCTVITPMNFIYGIPVIQTVACFLSGSPLLFKGHPFAGVTSTTLVKMLIAAGADPRSVHKVEGFGSDVAPLVADPRVAVVSVTGSVETARKIQGLRGVRPVRFEGGGCNWSWIDDGFSDAELERIAVRLAYSKLALGSHKCTSLHGIAATEATLDRIEPKIVAEMRRWRVADPRKTAAPDDSKVVGPIMVHRASTVTSIQESARAAGVRVLLEGGAVCGDDYSDHAEVAAPVVLGRISPATRIRVEWDGATREIALATTELFMPVLVTMAVPQLAAFLDFCLNVNPHDLATSLWSRDDRTLSQARSALAGMVKENDGTDSALEWEEFGASGVGESGNAGVGDAAATIGMFCRRQKGRHFVL